MINHVLSIDKYCLEETVVRYFIEACRLNPEKEKHQKMLERALAVRMKIISGINIRAVLSRFEKENLCGKVLNLNGIEFCCNAFEQFKRANIQGIFTYVLTVGSSEFKEDSVIDLFYADTWLTVYVDAARDDMKARISNEFSMNSSGMKTYVSDSFGPGYYGMPTNQIAKFFEVMDVEKIGVELVGEGMMYPLKSCAGIYIATNDRNELPEVNCRECIPSKVSCQFCRIKKGKGI